MNHLMKFSSINPSHSMLWERVVNSFLLYFSPRAWKPFGSTLPFLFACSVTALSRRPHNWVLQESTPLLASLCRVAVRKLFFVNGHCVRSHQGISILCTVLHRSKTEHAVRKSSLCMAIAFDQRVTFLSHLLYITDPNPNIDVPRFHRGRGHEPVDVL